MLDVGLKATFRLIEVDVEDVYKAIEKNGYVHLRGIWHGSNGACVLGQGALNLNVVGPMGGFEGIYPDTYDDEGESLGIMIGDGQGKRIALEEAYNAFSLERQLNLLSGLDEDHKWVIPRSHNSSVGSTIIYWNDAPVTDPITGIYKKVDGEYEYILKTYQEVVDMVYDILKDYFGQKVTLLTYDYS